MNGKFNILKIASWLMAWIVVPLFGNQAHAYFTVGESNELPKQGQYRIGAEPQFVFDGNGFNFSGFADTGYGKDGSVRLNMGLGDTSFTANLAYKWVPIPDYGNQPAIGGKVEASYARKNSSNWNALRLMPIVSKNFETDYGPVTPYGSLPLSLVSIPNTTQTDLQLVGGCEYRPPAYKSWMFGAELGLNLNNAFTYISGNVTYWIDDIEAPATKKR